MRFFISRFIFQPENKNTLWSYNDFEWVVNSALAHRMEISKSKETGWCLFVDHDVDVDINFTNYLKSILQTLDQKKIYAGLYRDSMNATYLQRIHNLICNQWLLEGEKVGQNRLLGGFFLMYVTPALQAVNWQNCHFWGAEESLIVKHLQKLNYQFCVRQDWYLVHNTSQSLRHFIKRAFLHGFNKDLNSSMPKCSRLNSFKLQIKSLNLYLVGFLLHYGLVLCGEIAQRFVPQHRNKLKELYKQ